jgi:RNA polymerase sigma-70 factor (ECF subfamily)
MARETQLDMDLVDRCNAGDEDAFEALYRAHGQWVLALAIRFTGNREDGLDALQETFAYLFGRFPGFRLTSSLRAFLYPVVKHSSISILRRRRKVVDLDTARDQGLEAAIGAAWQPEVPGDFDRLIEELPQGHQEVVRLRFALDLKLDEIADALGIPIGTVKSRLHTALETLRRKYFRTE